MKVIFLKNIKNVAQIGDIKEVADGYARNFLLKNGVAKVATADSAKQAETLKILRVEFDVKTKEKGIELAKKMENAVIEINGDANEQGHLYGSIDAKRIADKINNKYHLGISEDNINLPQHLKATGEHEVEIEFHPEVKTKMKVIVTSV
ncbi:MAG: 50S ribosomal protein L9 [Minisyncoccia bacterium]|jgi:large subunit ribosomal protein L9